MLTRSFICLLILVTSSKGCAGQSDPIIRDHQLFQEEIAQMEVLIQQLEHSSSEDQKAAVIWALRRLNKKVLHQLKAQQNQLYLKNLTILEQIRLLSTPTASDSLLNSTFSQLIKQYQEQHESTLAAYSKSKAMEAELERLKIAAAPPIVQYSGLVRALIILVIGVIILATINFLLKRFLPKRT